MSISGASTHPITNEKLTKMDLEQGHIYHLYNQGNNHEKIFFTKANYSYFLKKIEQHIFPMADILAWCLMPNHFHLIIAVPSESDRATSCHPVTLNSSIAIMLRSYTRAINIQEHRSGSLFRERTTYSGDTRSRFPVIPVHCLLKNSRQI